MASQASQTVSAGESATLDTALERTSSALADLQPELPLQFTFRWRQRHVIARVIERDQKPLLRLVTDLGVVPFSAENPHRRDQLLRLARPQHAPPNGHYALTDRQRLMYCSETPLPEPVTGCCVVSNVTTALLSSRPYFQVAATG